MDYTVSHKEFTIAECDSCKFKFTNPRPFEREIGGYYKSEDYISHSNTSKGFINSIYQSVRKYTIKKKVQLINSLNKKGRLLDIGCGTGEFLNMCQNNGWKTKGIEPSPEARRFGIDNYKLEIDDESGIEKLEDHSFEIITLWHVLEHVPQLNKRVGELKRLLKLDGTLIIAVPNCNSLDAKIYKEHWAAYDVPRHLYHFTPSDIESLFSKHKMLIINILPMNFDSFYVSILSEKYKNGTLNFFRALWNGFRSNMNGTKTSKAFSSQIYIIKNLIE